MITALPMRRAPGYLRATAFGLAALVAALDQVTKTLARSGLETAIDLTPFLALRLGFNPGVAFGLFADSGPAGRWALSGMTILVIGALLSWIWRTRSSLTAMAASLIVGGAFGNLIDRLRFGAVTDFIDLHRGEVHWPTFNLADAAIVCGVGLLLLAARETKVTAVSRSQERAP